MLLASKTTATTMGLCCAKQAGHEQKQSLLKNDTLQQAVMNEYKSTEISYTHSTKLEDVKSSSNQYRHTEDQQIVPSDEEEVVAEKEHINQTNDTIEHHTDNESDQSTEERQNEVKTIGVVMNKKDVDLS